LRKVLARQLVGCDQDAQGDRQVEAAAFLGQIRRCQIHGDAPCGKFKARILQRGPHAVLRFFNLRLRQADDGETRQAIRKVRLDRNERRIHSGERAAVEHGKRHWRPARYPGMQLR
jgi:hypothetical protein